MSKIRKSRQLKNLISSGLFLSYHSAISSHISYDLRRKKLNTSKNDGTGNNLPSCEIFFFFFFAIQLNIFLFLQRYLGGFFFAYFYY